MTPTDEEELDLKPEEEEEAEKRSAVRAHVVHAAILTEGEDELDRPAGELVFSGLAAGLSMGFSLMVEAILHAHLAPTPWRDLIVKAGYTVGFLIVVLGRQQLFTENTLTVVLPLLHRKDAKTMRDLVRVWTIVLAMNVVGAFLFALVLARTDLMQRDVAEALLAVATPALQHDFLRTMLRGIFAGWLIALMVWLQPGADSARIWVILIITWIVGAAEFSHIVAGSVEVLYLVCRGMATAAEFLRDFFLPTLLGNVIGGVSLVAALGHAQVRQK